MVSKELPSDIIFEVLTRTTSLKTLDTCKLVCKSWNNLIHETRFMPLYCQRTKNLSGYILHGIKENKFFSMFVSIDQSKEQEGVCLEGLIPDNMKILASCNQGILCCVKPHRNSNCGYYACKPATKQWKSLPNPKCRYLTVGVAIMVLSSSPLRYKIVRLSSGGRVGRLWKYRCEIFDSRIWRWKETEEVELDERILYSSISASNSAYWLASHNNVLAFYEPDETFRKLPLPREVLRHRHKKLLEYQGRLGLVCVKSEGVTELWTMIDCMNWRKKMVIDVESLVRDVTCPSLFGFYNDGIAFLNTLYEVVFYKLEDCSSRRVEVDDHLRLDRAIFRFRSDFEPVKLG